MKSFSEEIESFLNFLKEAQIKYGEAIAAESEADAATQDILHSLEIYEHTCEEFTKISQGLGKVRNDRRNAKDVKEQLKYIYNWMDEHKKALRALEKVLSNIKDYEKAIKTRTYTARTSIIKEIMEEQKDV
ncbi:MAG: hypothetical protein LUD81_07910 [Clostridiales bacterium]|nr:hypothetical protein [Clostridiales bacterium]